MPVSTRWSDTTPEAMEVFVALHRRMPASEKAARVLELTDMLYRLSLSDVRRLHPAASEREVFLRMVARRLDRELMLRAYGWHPDLGTPP